MTKQILTAERLRELFRYDQETGVFYRLARHGKWMPGPVGCDNGYGYIAILVDGKRYKGHRLAFLWMLGTWPVKEVDHIDGNRANNAWANLRDVSRQVNQRNIKKAKKSNLSTGLLGVSARNGRFRSVIRVDGKNRILGVFDTPEEAHQVYLEAKRIYHADGCTI